MSSVAPVETRADELPDDARSTIALAFVADRLRAERDWAIRGAHRHGLPIASIARMMNMTVQSVAQIVAR
jgi:hypothetical protein